MPAFCEACNGNVAPGKYCYACGLSGPAGQGRDPNQPNEATMNKELYIEIIKVLRSILNDNTADPEQRIKAAEVLLRLEWGD